MSKAQDLQATCPAASKPITITPTLQIPDFLFSTDLILLFAFIVWAAWDKLMRPKVTEKLDGVFAPVQEERRLTNILAQIGIITKCSRVVLAAFHNGALDSAGYHLQKLSTINTYTAPNESPIAYPIRDLPIGRIMTEVEAMLDANDWVEIVYDESLPQPCKDHLMNNDIYVMSNKLVMVGNLPIGILSIQYSQRYHGSVKPGLSHMHPQYKPLLDELYSEISMIMRRRVIHPSKFVMFFKYMLKNIRSN